jgi:hypothetical protein
MTEYNIVVLGWHIELGLHFRVDKALGCQIRLYSIQFGVGFYLFEHSLIAVDVNQSLHENLGGYF